MISVIDYGAGNLGSISSALNFLQREFIIVDSLKQLGEPRLILLPGVGHFGQAMKSLGATGVGKRVVEMANAGVPVLGICLGMQLLFESSDEAPNVPGLDLLRGKVLTNRKTEIPSTRIGWFDVEFSGPSAKFSSEYFFAHSFQVLPEDASLTTATYTAGQELVVAQVAKGSIIGMQFHPEKSGINGLNYLDDSIDLLTATR
jgi:glutamine amidotransferase